MIKIIEFNFSTRKESSIPPEMIRTEGDDTHYYWIQIDNEGIDDFITLLKRFCPETRIDSAFLRSETKELLYFFHDSLYFTFYETCFLQGKLATSPIRVILGKGFFATICEEDSGVINTMRKIYHDDFVNFSKSPGFLLFEIVDSLTNMYQQTYRKFDEEIDTLQVKLFKKVDDEIFISIANCTQRILNFREVLISALEVSTVLGTRKSPFISETTQPFLERKSNLIARLNDNLSTQRAMISDTLNLYMSFVSYKTNNLITRLTIFSLIFLPITFLAGVYGMNFHHMPELSWEYSYLVFWIMVVLIVGSLVFFFKYEKWL